MLRRTHAVVALAVFCALSAVGIFFLVQAHASAGRTAASDAAHDQAFYAEIPTSPAETPSVVAPSGTDVSLPILVYHIVRPSYPSDSRAVRALALTPENFDAEIRYLGEAGYHVVSFADLEDHWRNGSLLPPKPIILSFDDGWGDQFDYAFPILKKYRVTATFFVFTNSIGRHGFLTWDELREMRASGMTIGSHSRSHPYLTSITDSTALWREIHDSKEILEKRLGTTINEFAYPFGKYDAAIVALVEKAGYRSARGDYENKEGAANQLYGLGALNAPTTTELFEKKFPSAP